MAKREPEGVGKKLSEISADELQVGDQFRWESRLGLLVCVYAGEFKAELVSEGVSRYLFEPFDPENMRRAGSLELKEEQFDCPLTETMEKIGPDDPLYLQDPPVQHPQILEAVEKMAGMQSQD